MLRQEVLCWVWVGCNVRGRVGVLAVENLFSVAVRKDVALDSWVEEDVAAVVAVASSRSADAGSDNRGFPPEHHTDLVRAFSGRRPRYWPKILVFPWMTASSWSMIALGDSDRAVARPWSGTFAHRKC